MYHASRNVASMAAALLTHLLRDLRAGGSRVRLYHRSKDTGWLQSGKERWHKDFPLDAVLERDKKVLQVSTLKDILAKEPGMRMTLTRLGRHKQTLGVTRRVESWLENFPAIFQIHNVGTPAAWFTFTSEAARHVAKEKQFLQDNHGPAVERLRRLLMMAPNRRIPLSLLTNVRTDLGLPEDLAPRHPDVFRVAEEQLELAQWDSAMAVSLMEMVAQPESDEVKLRHWSNVTYDRHGYLKLKHVEEQRHESGAGTRLPQLIFSKKRDLKRSRVEEVLMFQQAPPASPYSQTPPDLHPGSQLAEKHAVAVIHELISLTLLKRASLDSFLTPFAFLLRTSKPLVTLLLHHPEHFYVSLKGERQTVFLRDAYKGSCLIVDDPLVALQRSWIVPLLSKCGILGPSGSVLSS